MATKEQFLQDVMTTAVEGGMGYWADMRRVKRDEELNVLTFDVRDSEDNTTNWEQIDADRVDRAIYHIINGNIKDLHSSYVRQIAEAYAGITDDTYDIDADLADIIIQVAAFDEVIFG